MLSGFGNYETGTSVTWVLGLWDKCKCYLGVETLRQMQVLPGC